MLVVQKNAGGSGGGTTSAVGFGSTTTAGSMLQCVVRASITDSADPNITVNLPSTLGFTWTLVNSSYWSNSFYESGLHMNVYSEGIIAIYEIANAGVMATTVKTTVTASNSGQSPSVSFNLYEISGLASSTPVDVSAASYADSAAIVPGVGTLVTANTDFIFVATTLASASTGSGYTAGVSADEQYILNQVAGSVPTSFGSSATTYWAAVGVAYSGAAVFASPSGLSLSASLGTATASGSAVASPTGLTISLSEGTAVGNQTPASTVTAYPLGLSLSASLGTASAIGSFNFNYGNVVAGSSGIPCNSTYFYARFEGFLIPQQSGLYTVGMNASGGVNLFISGKPVISDLTAQKTANSTMAYTDSSQISLTAGVWYPIVVEWQTGAGGGNYECQLLWTPPNGNIQQVTAPYLSSENGGVQATPDQKLNSQWWNGTAALWYPSGNGVAANAGLLPTYANNTAAVAGGLAVGALYRATGTDALNVVHP